MRVICEAWVVVVVVIMLSAAVPTSPCVMTAREARSLRACAAACEVVLRTRDVVIGGIMVLHLQLPNTVARTR
jgi:hypothetical protein